MHSGTGGHLTMSSLDNNMNEEETLTWVEQHVVTATGWGAIRTSGNKRWEANREGKPPALKLSTLKSTQEVIEPGGKPDGATFRVHGGPLWMMLPTTMTKMIYKGGTQLHQCKRGSTWRK